MFLRCLCFLKTGGGYGGESISAVISSIRSVKKCFGGEFDFQIFFLGS